MASALPRGRGHAQQQQRRQKRRGDGVDEALEGREQRGARSRIRSRPYEALAQRARQREIAAVLIHDRVAAQNECLSAGEQCAVHHAFPEAHFPLRTNRLESLPLVGGVGVGGEGRYAVRHRVLIAREIAVVHRPRERAIDAVLDRPTYGRRIALPVGCGEVRAPAGVRPRVVFEQGKERAPSDREPARAQDIVMLPASGLALGDGRVMHGNEADVGEVLLQLGDAVGGRVIRHDDLEGRRTDLCLERAKAAREMAGMRPGLQRIAHDHDDRRQHGLRGRHRDLAHSTLDRASPGPRTQPTHSPATRTTTAGPSSGSA